MVAPDIKSSKEVQSKAFIEFGGGDALVSGREEE